MHVRPDRVLDAQDEDALVVPREGPVEERGAGAAHVEGTRGAGSKSDSDRVRHGHSFYPDAPGWARDRI